jgi:hypothetical protein
LRKKSDLTTSSRFFLRKILRGTKFKIKAYFCTFFTTLKAIEMVNTIDENFHKRRAEALSYVYFSRLNNLIIKETGEDSPFFDYLY